MSGCKSINMKTAHFESLCAHAPSTRAVELAIVIPTYNERGNVALLVERLDNVLDGVAGEAIFVDDDSPDRTADEVREVSVSDARVRIVQRIGRRGLASACVEGMLATSASIEIRP